MRTKVLRAAGLFGLLIVLLGIGAVIKIGPRFLFGILRYDTRHEGTLRISDRAPDVGLVALDGTSTVHLAERIGHRPLVLVFGSFT